MARHHRYHPPTPATIARSKGRGPYSGVSPVHTAQRHGTVRDQALQEALRGTCSMWRVYGGPMRGYGKCHQVANPIVLSPVV